MTFENKIGAYFICGTIFAIYCLYRIIKNKTELADPLSGLAYILFWPIWLLCLIIRVIYLKVTKH